MPGVYQQRGRWSASVTVKDDDGGQRIKAHLGSFDSQDGAHGAYDACMLALSLPTVYHRDDDVPRRLVDMARRARERGRGARERVAILRELLGVRGYGRSKARLREAAATLIREAVRDSGGSMEEGDVAERAMEFARAAAAPAREADAGGIA